MPGVKRKKADADQRKFVNGFCTFRYKSVHTFPTQLGKNSAEMEVRKDFKISSFKEYVETECDVWKDVFKMMGCDSDCAASALDSIRRAMETANPKSDRALPVWAQNLKKHVEGQNPAQLMIEGNSKTAKLTDTSQTQPAAPHLAAVDKVQ